MMDIIFVKIPKYLDPIIILIRKCSCRVYYLELSHGLGDTKETKDRRVAMLKYADILPLPIENLPHISRFTDVNSDPEKKGFKRTQQIAPKTLLMAFAKLFPHTTNITDKLQIVVHSAVATHLMEVTGNVNIWANANQDRDYLLIDFNPRGFLTSELSGNVRLLVVPLDIFAKGVDVVFKIFHKIVNLLISIFTFKAKSRSPIEPHYQNISQSRVTLVTHKGIDYGNLYRKELFYSDRIDSYLHPEKLLHIDYSGWTNPSEKLKWACLGNHRQSWILNISSAFVAVSTGILHIRHMRHILGLLILTQSYIIFRSFSTKIVAYPNLQVALIDYEILCPKELLLAFESKGIKTVAVQERYILAFNNLFGSTILNHYLCDSQYAADTMKKSPLYSVDYYLPVGQYRSDSLLKFRQSPPPQILETPLAKGLHVITALGYHTTLEWQNSQPDPLLSWSAHRHFLEDMIRLSKEISDVFIILRYKDVDWISLPVFADIVEKINSLDNMIISMEYEKPFFSYDLCAHSDLVIAKHTSLADECLSVGIPVLFHEYTHNTERLIANEFHYRPARIVCFNYQELKERAKIILSGTPNAMTQDYEYLKDVVYGGLGDGKVKERIHIYIEELLSEL